MVNSKIVSMIAALLLTAMLDPVGSFAAGVPGRGAIPRHVRPLKELRNADIAQDAIARALEAQREREAYRPLASNVRIVSANVISDAQARKAGIRVPATANRSLILVTVHLRDTKAIVWENQYAYDNATHLCIGFTERFAFPAGHNKPATPVVF